MSTPGPVTETTSGRGAVERSVPDPAGASALVPGGGTAPGSRAADAVGTVADGAPRPVVVRAGRTTVRTRVVVAVAAVVCVVGVVVALLVGDYPISPRGVLDALVGRGDDLLGRMFVVDVRLPRALGALLVGASLGASGALLQTATRNDLGSPDVVGFTTGAATGALLQIVVLDAGPGGVAVGALVGGLVTALVVTTLARRAGGTTGRIVLVGVGVGASLQALNGLLVVRASLGRAQSAAQWLAGSLNAVSWAQLVPLVLGVVILLPLGAALSRDLGLTLLGDDLAAGLGVRPRHVRRRTIFVAVGLMALATATTGPVAFVALAAPHLARRLTRGHGTGLGSAAVVGAAVVLVADLLAQRLFAPSQLPVGVVTGIVGGVYLVVLLLAGARRAR